MRSPRFLPFVLFVFFADCLPAARAEEPFFKKGDVIAIVGGEDMVALSEYGYLELLLTRALPDYHLRFRNLAWEGDTVFEQRRDLGFPTWEEQLAKIGATVVLCQFGQMESLAGKEKLPEFIAAYEKLLARFSGGGERRVVLLYPPWIGLDIDFDKLSPQLFQLQKNSDEYAHALQPLAEKLHCLLIIPALGIGDAGPPVQRDNLHFNEYGHLWWADRLYSAQGWFKKLHYAGGDSAFKGPLLDLIIAKNRLWFDYWRVQNWAFLAGDRTNQPSSRDHLDPAKRWFPEERERFLPLIEAREKEIDALAAKLAQP